MTAALWLVDAFLVGSAIGAPVVLQFPRERVAWIACITSGLAVTAFEAVVIAAS